MALAMLEMPAEVSGISPLQHSALVDKALEATHGETISEIKQLERAISLAEAAVDLGRTEIIKESESSVGDFNAIASAYEKGEIAWLRKSASEVHVVDLQRGVGRVPTPEELETGEYFSNYAEYAEANGLPPQPPGA
jgi:hypothetical protein